MEDRSAALDAGDARTDDFVTIPVIATLIGLRWVSPWVALASNSLNPSLRLGVEGMEYRVLRRRHMPYTAIQSVEMRTAPGTVNLHFVFRDAAFTFTANVANKKSAQDALRRLPPSVPRGKAARELERG